MSLPSAKAALGVLRLGLIEYSKSLNVQNVIFEFVKSKRCPWDCGVLLLVEHPPVYTIGIRTRGYSAEDEDKLRSLGADFHRIKRGGLITFHGPGQLVAYPIVDIRIWKPSVRWYIKNLEETVIKTCSKLSIDAHRYNPYPGIWVGEDKLCAVGVRVSRYITSHGIALNCNTDLDWFKHIIPCGIEGKGVTSLSNLLNKPVTVENVLPHFLDSFCHYFPCEPVHVNLEEFSRSYCSI